MGTWTNFKFKGFFINWATVFVGYICTYMTVFANTVYFHISGLLMLVDFLNVNSLKLVMVSLLFVEESLRSEGDNEKKRKRVKRNEIQCMILF